MTPRKSDIHAVAHAMERKGFYIASAAASALSYRDGIEVEKRRAYQITLMNSALRLLLRERDKVIRAANRWADSAPGDVYSEGSLVSALDDYDESRRARRKAVRG